MGTRPEPLPSGQIAGVTRMIPVKKLALAGAVALATSVTYAGTARADAFWDRWHNQQDRIEQGVDNGNLTRSEANRLEEQERQVARERAPPGEKGPPGSGHAWARTASRTPTAPS